MLEPIGPLPPEIYWRRRVLALSVAAVVVLLVLWLVIAMSGGSDAAPAKSANATSDLATVTPAGSPTPTPPGSTNTMDPGMKPNPSASGGPATPIAVPAGQCPDQSLALKVSPDKPTYAVGEEPSFTIVVTNVSTQACGRDLATGTLQALTYSIDGQNRLWSSADCYPPTNQDIKQLDPGKQQVYTIKWSGTTSQPQCAGNRVQVGPGAYQVVAQLGSLHSDAEPFNIG